MELLTWENWYRSEGCRNWMDKTLFAETPFSTIFWQGMRLVFLDEKKHKGILYKGNVYTESLKIVAANNGKRVGFNLQQQQQMLFTGRFHYNDASDGNIRIRLRFEGPDKSDLAAPIYIRSDVNGYKICIQFYNIVKDAIAGTGSFKKQDALGNWHPNPVPQTAAGTKQLAYFTAAHVLAGIMINHGFTHSNKTIGQPDYLATLPEVALHAVLNVARNELGEINSSSLPLISTLGGVAQQGNL